MAIGLSGCLSVHLIAHALMLCLQSLPVSPLHAHTAASLPAVLALLACLVLLCLSLVIVIL